MPQSSGGARRRAPIRGRIAALLALAVVAAGCSGTTGSGDSADPPRESDAEDSTTSTSERAEAGAGWDIDLPVIGQPVAAGEVAVVYSQEGGRLALVGVDPETGEERWTEEAGPGYVVTGIPIYPVVVDGRNGEPAVAYFRPTNSAGALMARLIVADPVTGEDLASSTAELFIEPPAQCDDGQDVCARTGGANGSQGRVRLELESGETVPEPQPEADSQRAIGNDGLTDLRIDGTQYIARVDGDSIQWKTPVATAFGPGFSTDGGWSWEHHRAEGIFVGTIGTAPVEEPAPVDLSRNKTVALDDATGQVRWSNDGSGVWCSSNLAIPAPLQGAFDRPAQPIRCRLVGTAVPGDEPTFEGLDVTLEGFDVSTGATTWAARLGDMPAILYGGGASAVVDDRTTAIRHGDTVEAIDLTDGTTGPVDPAEALGCSSEVVEFDYARAYPGPKGPVKKRIGGTLAFACDPQLEPVDGPLEARIAEAMGVAIGTMAVVATQGHLVGLPTG